MEIKREPSFKEILESATYEWQKWVVNKEINKNKLEINRKEFKKTDEEKEKLLNLKLAWKLSNPSKPKLIGRYEF